MQNKEQAIQEAMRLAQSPAGRQLINLLQQSDPQQLRQIMDSAAKGDAAQAQKSLSALLGSQEAQQLLNQLGR